MFVKLSGVLASASPVPFALALVAFSSSAGAVPQ